MLCPLNGLEESGIVMLESLCGFEGFVELLMIVVGCVCLRLTSEITDTPFVLCDGLIEPLQSGIDACHLVVTRSQLCSCFLLGCCR